MKRRALVTGCAGQVGSYMVELLLAHDYEVFGLIRRSSSLNLWRITHILNRLKLLEGDITDDASLKRALVVSKPNEIYHFAAQSNVSVSFLEPLHTTDVTAIGALRLFEAVRTHTSISEAVRIYQASSSEQFGNAILSPQDELTPMHPVSPYGCAKLFAHRMAHVYRQSYGMFITCGIAYNHESPRRSEEFVTRKITRSLALIRAGQLDKLRLGNVLAKRDWSHVTDIVWGAWLSLQYARPEDWVFASGEQHSVQEFARVACQEVGLNPEQTVVSEASLFRPQDIESLMGDSSKARRELKWMPTVSFPALVKEMVYADLSAVGLGDPVPSEGQASPSTSAPIDSEADLPAEPA